MRATIKKKILSPYWKPSLPTTATVPLSIDPPAKAMLIILVITEGAVLSLPVKSVIHLQMIMRSI